MKKNRLLESLNRDLGDKIPTKRYTLADMISESYSTVFKCEEGSNLKRLAESHLNDVRENPKDIERLSRQLSIIKELNRMTESGELKDEDLVDKKNYDTVEGNEDRVIVNNECNECDDPKVQESAHRKSHKTQESCASKKDVIKEADDPDLTDEELEELAKHLETIRKDRKNAPKKEMTEEATPTRRGLKCTVTDSKKEDLDEADIADRRVHQLGVDIFCPEDKMEAVKDAVEDAVISVGPECSVSGIMWGDNSWSAEEYGIKESKKVEESKEYAGLQNFKKQSESKAFYKTFKKMNDTLKEGKALTRQESIDLYKASNSALTQLSIELEHNPEFLDTFKESVTLLSKDVTSLLESLTRGKAPSKNTMRSLAKFSEALLFEAEDEDDEEEIDDIEKDVEDTDEEVPAGETTDEEGQIPEEGDFDDFVGDDEGDIASEEADAFDQEYADARVELHKELVANHADDEDPGVQEKIDQDAAEVVNLPGTTEEQIAEINGEEPSDDAEEEAPEEEEADDAEITDDELEELKSHLKEMRAAKKGK